MASGQVLARLDSGIAQSNVVAAEAALNQATAQLEVDRSGVTPQSLASARASITSARAALVAARRGLVHALGVNRDTIAAAKQQVSQARASMVSASNNPAPRSQAAAAARAVVDAAREALAGAKGALADVRASSMQQAATLQHNIEAAMRDLVSDQSKLGRDLAAERHFCGTNSPIIASDTSSECVNAAATVTSDQQTIIKDQAAVQAAQDAATQGQINAAQSEHQALVQVASASGALASARDQLNALKVSNAQAFGTARSGLAQARSKAAESASQARAQVRAAAIGLVNADDALTALRQGAPGPLIAQDRSKIVAARAQVGVARAAVEETVVRSPVAGTVTWVFVAPGSPADASTPIAVVADLEHLAVSVDLSEFDAAQVKQGLPAIVSVDALAGKRFRGKVLFEALTGVDNGGVVTFPVRVGLTRFSGLKPGMNVSVRIVVAQRRNVVRVPLEAVTREGGGRATVTVVGSSGRESTRSVRLGLSDNKNVEVRSGLRPGERVLLASAAGV